MKIEYRRLSIGEPDAIDVDVEDNTLIIRAFCAGEGLEFNGRCTSFGQEFAGYTPIPQYFPDEELLPRQLTEIAEFVALAYGLGQNPLPLLRRALK